MEDMDKNEVSNNGISEDEDLIMREVIQGDVDLYYLHHYLSEICRRASGRSAGYFVDLFTLQEVARLLSDKRLSIAQIADELSFSSASYFTRYVKKHFGMSPKAFRKAGTL